MKVSHRLETIPMSGIRKMFDLATPDSINLGLGEPDLDPPLKAIEGMIEASKKGFNKYGPTSGIPELRESVAKRYSKYGKINSGNIMITPSGSSGLLEVMQSFVETGDEVLVPSPGFVIYYPHVQLAGGTPVEYKLTEREFQPDMEDILSKVTKKTKIIVVNSPSNPTGGVMNKDTYKALLDFAEDYNVCILSDEVYDSYIYEGEHISFMNNLDKAIVVNSFSKTMAVPGWRMGFLCVDEKYLDPLIKMQYHICACPNVPAQYGILNALPSIDEYLDSSRKIFKNRRDLICKRINEIDGFNIIAPKGSFYAFPKYDLDICSADLAIELVKNGLICTPGSVFGAYGEGHLRFSYASNEEKINKGMDILANTVKDLKRNNK